jgi:hypothetical protein
MLKFAIGFVVGVGVGAILRRGRWTPAPTVSAKTWTYRLPADAQVTYTGGPWWMRPSDPRYGNH